MGVRAAQEGHGTGWLFDLGRACLPGLGRSRGSVAGQTLLVSYAEKTHDGAVISDPHTYCSPA